MIHIPEEWRQPSTASDGPPHRAVAGVASAARYGQAVVVMPYLSTALFEL